MPRSLRLALVVLGLTVAVYGAASLTGAWLGQPPWWTKTPGPLIAWSDGPYSGPDSGLRWERLESGPRPGREWISAGIVVAGLFLSVLAKWNRRGQRLGAYLNRSVPTWAAMAAGVALLSVGSPLVGLGAWLWITIPAGDGGVAGPFTALLGGALAFVGMCAIREWPVGQRT